MNEVFFNSSEKSFLILFSGTRLARKNCVAVGHDRVMKTLIPSFIDCAPFVHSIIVGKVMNKMCELNILIDSTVCCFDGVLRKLFYDPLRPLWEKFKNPVEESPKLCFLFAFFYFSHLNQ